MLLPRITCTLHCKFFYVLHTNLLLQQYIRPQSFIELLLICFPLVTSYMYLFSDIHGTSFGLQIIHAATSHGHANPTSTSSFDSTPEHRKHVGLPSSLFV